MSKAVDSQNEYAKWYFDQFSGDKEEWYRIFFRQCKKYGITWKRATKEEKKFVVELTTRIQKNEKGENAKPLIEVVGHLE